MALTHRWGNFQPFVRSTERADGRQGGFEGGVVTYSQVEDLDTETYQVSSFELAGRSDHLSDPLCALFNVEQVDLCADAPLDSDADLMRKRTEKSDSKSKASASTSNATEVAA